MWRAWEVDSYDGATGLTRKLRSTYTLKDAVSAPRLRWEGYGGWGCGEGGTSMSSEWGVTG